MASVTKTFVATAVMQLVEQGKIDLDALIAVSAHFKMEDERYRQIRFARCSVTLPAFPIPRGIIGPARI